jgi:hypothetical protein
VHLYSVKALNSEKRAAKKSTNGRKGAMNSCFILKRQFHEKARDIMT